MILVLLMISGCKNTVACNQSPPIDGVATQLTMCLSVQDSAEYSGIYLDKWGYPSEILTANLIASSPTLELILSYRTTEEPYDPQGKLAVLERNGNRWEIVYESPSPQAQNSNDSHRSLAGNWWFDLAQVGDIQGDGGDDVLFQLRWSNLTSSNIAHAKLLTAPTNVVEIVAVEDDFLDHEPIYEFATSHIKSMSYFSSEVALTRTLTLENGEFVVSAEIANPNAATQSIITADGTHYFTFDSECGFICWHTYGLYRERNGEQFAYGMPVYVRSLKQLRDGNIYIGSNELFVVNGDRLEPPDFAPLLNDYQIHDMAMTSKGEVWAAAFLEVLHFGHEESTVYDLIANTISITPDDTVWIDGWDGLADSGCCIFRIENGVVETFQKDETSIPHVTVDQ